MGVADGLADLVGDGVDGAVDLGVAVALGLTVGDGVFVTEVCFSGIGVTVGLTKMIRIAPSSGTGERIGFFLVMSTNPIINTILINSRMSVMAATVFFRSSIPLQYYKYYQ